MWAYKKLPTYKTRSKIIRKMPKVEIPNRDEHNYLGIAIEIYQNLNLVITDQVSNGI
jgi:hypothetical protein